MIAESQNLTIHEQSDLSLKKIERQTMRMEAKKGGGQQHEGKDSPRD